MEVLIRSKIEVTDAMENYLHEKFTKLEKFKIVDDAKITVQVKPHKDKFKLNVMVNSKHADFKVEAIEQDYYSAVDKAESMVKEKILKIKELSYRSLQKHHNKITNPIYPSEC